MKLKNKKIVFAVLVLITVGSTVGGVFIPPLFALTGTALVATIAAGKVISDHEEDGEQAQATPNASLTPNPQAHEVSSPPSHNLSPPSLAPSSDLRHWVEEKKDDPLARPELQRDFSMHISYQTNQHSPGGTQSPDAINVTVHTRSPDSAHTSPQHTPETGLRALPSPLRLTRKLSTTEGY